MPRTSTRKKTARKKTTRKRKSRVGSTKKRTSLQSIDKRITSAMNGVAEGRKGSRTRLRKLIVQRGKMTCKCPTR